jgi:dihydroxyacid dehydratase/phosphogluconate dehydratase
MEDFREVHTVLCWVHTPEKYDGGGIALIKDGDVIAIDSQ